MYERDVVSRISGAFSRVRYERSDARYGSRSAVTDTVAMVKNISTNYAKF